LGFAPSATVVSATNLPSFLIPETANTVAGIAGVGVQTVNNNVQNKNKEILIKNSDNKIMTSRHIESPAIPPTVVQPTVTSRSPSPSQDHDIDDGSSSKRQVTRVFKKGSSNGKITVYLGKRDFVDHITHVDPIDGVVLIDPDYVIKDRKVFGHVLAAFRYGREDLDVLGLTFRKDLYLASEQVFYSF